MRRGFLLAAALAFVALPACVPSAPDAPTYKTDVQPIFMARCVRCHGAGDMLQGDPVATNTTTPTPTICYLQRFDDGGDCSVASTCKHGAHYCATLYGTYISADDSSKQRMPPLPADRLNDWEMDVLNRWAKNPLP